jgi:hypothetical protein
MNPRGTQPAAKQHGLIRYASPKEEQSKGAVAAPQRGTRLPGGQADLLAHPCAPPLLLLPAPRFCSKPPLSNLRGTCLQCWRCSLFPAIYGQCPEG